MPPLPASEIARRAHLTDAVLGPSGAAAWVSVAGREAELVVRDGAGAVRRVAATARPHPSGNGIVRFVDDHRMAFVSPDGPLVVLDRRGGPARVLVDAPAATGLAVSADAATLAASFDDATRCDVRLVDVATGEAQVVSDADFAWDPAFSPDGRLVVWHEWDLPNMPWDASRIVAYDRADGTRRVLAGGEDIAVGQPRFAPDGTLGYLCDERGWYVVTTGAGPLASGVEHAPPALGPGQRSWAWVDGGAVWCTEYRDADVRSVEVARDGSARAVGAGRIAALDAGGGHTLAVAQSPAAPPAIVLDGRVVAEVGSAAGAAPLPRPQVVEWAGAGGAVSGVLWVPGSDATGALLVDVHGGPVGAAVADHDTARRAAFWTSRGWAVLMPNPRGSTGRGRAWTRALMGEWGVADVDDVAAAIRAAPARGWCEPGRVAVTGASAGGFTALLVALRHPELVRAVVVSYPVADLAECAQDTWRFESRYFDTLVGVLPAAEPAYRERSPATHAPRLRVPLLVFQGADDVVVPEHQTRALVERVPGVVEYVVYEGEGHGFKDPAHVLDEYATTDAFLARHVLQP